MKLKNLLSVCTLIALTSGSAAAALPTTATTPDPAANPVFATIQKGGAKFYYFGNRFGMDGWFIVKDGKVQIAYGTVDNKGALIGAMFGENGENITALQIATLMQNNKEISELINAAQREQSMISQVGSPPPASVAPAPNSMPATAMSPGERLMTDLANASTIVIGKAGSPEILMVMDPRCPHCQAAWKALRETVIKGDVHLRMIPIGAPSSDNERAAAVLITSTDPLTAWDKYVGGDKDQLAGTPSAAALAAVRANHSVIDNWKIEDTPYLVYRAKDGKVKIVRGEPEKTTVVLGDLGIGG